MAILTTTVAFITILWIHVESLAFSSSNNRNQQRKNRSHQYRHIFYRSDELQGYWKKACRSAIFFASEKNDDIFGSYSDDGNEGDSTRLPPSSTVGDYVQGVHGGKYQFEDPGGATFAGRQFAESLYAASGNDDNDYYSDVSSQEKEEAKLPNWVKAMGSAVKLGSLVPLANFPVIHLEEQSQATITVKNEERSWEHFYAKLMEVDPQGQILDDTAVLCHLSSSSSSTASPPRHLTMLVSLSPATGHLAPRGGSSNLCDPSQPYSDSATIQIRKREPTIPSGPPVSNNHLLLVIGTEAETWKYWIQLAH